MRSIIHLPTILLPMIIALFATQICLLQAQDPTSQLPPGFESPQDPLATNPLDPGSTDATPAAAQTEDSPLTGDDILKLDESKSQDLNAISPDIVPIFNQTTEIIKKINECKTTAEDNRDKQEDAYLDAMAEINGYIHEASLKLGQLEKPDHEEDSESPESQEKE